MKEEFLALSTLVTPMTTTGGLAGYTTYDACNKWSDTREGSRETLFITAAASSVSSTALGLSEHFGTTDIRKIIENRSLNTYVSSMSDAELEAALVKFNLLEAENNSNKIIK